MHGMGGGRGNLYNGWNGMEDLTIVWSPPPKKWGEKLQLALLNVWEGSKVCFLNVGLNQEIEQSRDGEILQLDTSQYCWGFWFDQTQSQELIINTR
mmetsp:Transcript_8293/g.10506  ORF Transcript_8293/g.10506 Transcript_8293/m.10506 type:complete len:96 (-) Transcript_8293:24-311(-)|eukprot:scaffold2604_cov198-Alexandrium_tamarense.AAC.2